MGTIAQYEVVTGKVSFIPLAIEYDRVSVIFFQVLLSGLVLLSRADLEVEDGGYRRHGVSLTAVNSQYYTYYGRYCKGYHRRCFQRYYSLYFPGYYRLFYVPYSLNDMHNL